MGLVNIGDHLVEYSIRLSKRAKRMSVVVHWNGECEVVVPEKKHWNDATIQKLFEEYGSWVAKTVFKQKQNANKIPLDHRGISRDKIQNETSNFVQDTIRKVYCQYPFKVSKIKIRSYKSRWGSCSPKHDLAFHYKLSMLPEHLGEYIIIHELCHTVHFNHSKDFWNMVGQFCSDYKMCKKELKGYFI